MGLLDQIQKDIQRITTDQSGFGVQLTMKAPSGEVVTFTGLHTKINMGVDDEGNIINSRRAHISFSEKVVTDLGYPVRNSSGEVDLKNHLVIAKDSTGADCNYMFMSVMPDETIGLITAILEIYNGTI